MTEFKIGDVIVEIGDYQEWVVYTEPDFCFTPGLSLLRIKPIVDKVRGVPVLGDSTAFGLETANSRFVKVRSIKHWRDYEPI